MTPEQLRARSKKFTVDIIRFVTTIPRNPVHDRLATQLADAASAGGSACRSACRARSRADFIYKLGNAIEEIDESAFWLEVLEETGTCEAAAIRPLWREADELTRILVKSRGTARGNS